MSSDLASLASLKQKGRCPGVVLLGSEHPLNWNSSYAPTYAWILVQAVVSRVPPRNGLCELRQFFFFFFGQIHSRGRTEATMLINCCKLASFFHILYSHQHVTLLWLHESAEMGLFINSGESITMEHVAARTCLLTADGWALTRPQGFSLLNRILDLKIVHTFWLRNFISS